VLDNVGAHKPDKIRHLVKAAERACSSCRPYSPDLNPINPAGRELKAALKDFGARTRDALDVAARRGMDLIGTDDARTWFTHCGTRLMGSEQHC
jgi:transposase